jgi:protein-S-isoprenylcysteine O-methyltransferase Ste14
MEVSLFAILGAVFIYAGTLPATFFKPDSQKTLGWFLSCVPFFGLPLTLALAMFGSLQSAVPPGSMLGHLLNAASSLLALGSALLIRWSVSSHTEAIALWHQEHHQPPTTLVTDGPYRIIRHPFYSAYLLLFMSVFLAIPHWSTAFLLAWGVIANSLTAIREEKVLSQGPMGSAYHTYAQQTGRFFPRLFTPPMKSV